MKILAEASKRYPCVPDTATSEEAAEREGLHEGFVMGARWAAEEVLNKLCDELAAFNKLSFLGLPTYDVEGFREEMKDQIFW